MTLSAHQPSYLPWLGLFHKLAHCDSFIVLDDVEMSGKDKNNWCNRCVIAGPGGETMLTVPLRHRHGKRIREIEVNGDRWMEKHRKALDFTYPRHNYGSLIQPPVAHASDVHKTTVMLAELLRITTPMVLQSEHPTEATGEDMLLGYCRMFGADRFLFGAMGRDYVTLSKWERAGIAPIFSDFTVPEYERRGPKPTRILSVVDAIAHVGIERTREMVVGG